MRYFWGITLLYIIIFSGCSIQNPVIHALLTKKCEFNVAYKKVDYRGLRQNLFLNLASSTYVMTKDRLYVVGSIDINNDTLSLFPQYYYINNNIIEIPQQDTIKKYENGGQYLINGEKLTRINSTDCGVNEGFSEVYCQIKCE